jgi:two-component system sensor histidine kinase/response regulator
VAAVRDHRPFRLVLLDANMPDVDGFAVAEAIAATPSLASATVMMLTSSGEYGDQARCAELGIAAYLTKPVFAADLLAAVERVLDTKPPAKTATAVSKPSAGTLALAAGGTRVRVLLVEDNVVNQRVAAGLLTRRGHSVTIAQHGGEALACLAKDRFDVVLMDLQMPVMSGIEATHAIRARESASGEHVRIVAMTAHAMDGDRERCLEAGMDGYLAKPIDPPRLFAAVEQASDSAAAAAATVSTMTQPVFDERALLERLYGDAGLMATVIAVFLEDCPARLAAIHHAVTARDTAGVRAAAHSLAGAAGNLSATGLFIAAKALERAGDESQMAVDDAWRELSIEADRVIDALRRWMAAADSQSVSR